MVAPTSLIPLVPYNPILSRLLGMIVFHPLNVVHMFMLKYANTEILEVYVAIFTLAFLREAYRILLIGRHLALVQDSLMIVLVQLKLLCLLIVVLKKNKVFCYNKLHFKRIYAFDCSLNALMAN